MTTSATAGYGGYEYQIVVTVWLALDLIVARSWCEAIEIEPASQEDVAAELQVSPDSASSTVSVTAEPGPIDIQIKKHSGVWTLPDVRALIETPEKRGARGPDPRPRALDRLIADPRLRYVLVTSAQVNTDVRPFVVESIGSRSAGRAIGTVASGDDALTRVGILEQQVPPLVEYQIDALLELSARVPLQRVAACRAALVEAVRLGLLGRRASRFDRADLTEIVTAHGGIPASAADEFVAPVSFGDLARRLEEPPFALILIGPPGIGKTATAQNLIDDHRRAARPFDVLKDATVGEVRAAIARPGRTLFYLEDPWGRYRRTDEGDVWTDELPRLIREANGNPDKRFLVTSRTGILADSISLNPATDVKKISRQVGAYVVKLDEADFDATRRREILRRRMLGADRWQRDWMDDIAADVVAQLTVPQALATFAQRLRSLPRGTTPKLEELVAESQVDAIAGIVARQARELRAIESTVVLWTFLGTTEPLTPQLAREVSTWLQSDGNLAVDIPRLVAHLEANGWIAVRDDHLAAHPTVVEGLERVVDAEPVATDRVVRALFSTLVARGEVSRATRIAGRLQGRALPIPASVRTAIEDHLRSAVLGADGAEFPRAVRLLTRISTARDPVSLLVRALTSTRVRHGFDSWAPPAWADMETDLVRASPEAEEFARRWIRLGLHQQTRLLDEELLVRFLGYLGWDLTEDFTAAAIDAMDHGSTSEIALLGALAAPDPPFDRLLEAALRTYDEVERWFEEEGHREQLRAEEGELDAGYSAHVLEEPGERFYAPSKALELIVRARRARQGFGWLATHSRRPLLVKAWAAAIPFDGGNAVSEELRALLAAAEDWNRSDVWKAIGRARCYALTRTALEALGKSTPEEMTFVWTGLFGLYAPDELPKIVGPGLRELDWPRRAATVFAAKWADIPDRGDQTYRDPESHRASVLSLLTAEERAAVELCIAEQDDTRELRTLDEGLVKALLEMTEGPNDRIASLAVFAVATGGRSTPGAAERLFASGDKWARLHVLRAVHAIVPADRAFIRRGFSDRYYQCRRFAMYVLAEGASADERAAIVSMAADRSGPVREACAKIIGIHKWSEGLTVLCGLLSDRRDREQGAVMSDAMPDYHVARAAARALQEFAAPLPHEVFEQVLRFVDAGSRATDDLVVHRELVSVLARHREEAVAPLIEHLLRSERRAGGASGTFPLRYEAAWSWFDHLLSYPDDAMAIPSSVLSTYATHTDDRLAAPALLSLGVIAQYATADVERVLGDSGTTANRALLLEAGARVGGSPLAGELLNPVLPPSDPGRRLLAWCWDMTSDPDMWKARLDADGEVQRWLGDVQARHPIQAALRGMLLLAPRSSLLGDISIDDLRSGELPAAPSVITTFHFAGLE
jgi:hypothetical protein